MKLTIEIIEEAAFIQDKRWMVFCPELKKFLYAGTKRQAIVGMANYLKTVSAKKLEEALMQDEEEDDEDEDGNFNSKKQ